MTLRQWLDSQIEKSSQGAAGNESRFYMAGQHMAFLMCMDAASDEALDSIMKGQES